VGPATQGVRIIIEGTVRDGSGAAAPDVLVEVWQANAAGRYQHPDDAQDKPVDPAFDGFGRVATDALGRFVFETIKPGPVPGPGGRPQAPHLVVGVMARGLLANLVTRIYFEDEEANARDPILEIVPAERRGTLIASRLASGRYRFDVRLQGENETVFFDV
jgi:protocatechuate 3,4-dioxygenase alpha subunit